jgi:hypothetical protein
MDKQRIDYPRLLAAANSYFLSKINMVTSKSSSLACRTMSQTFPLCFNG